MSDLKLGAGIMNQIQQSNKAYYKPFSTIDFEDIVFDMFEKPQTEQELKTMLGRKQVTHQEYTRILNMINSPDRENYVLAKELMEIKKPNQHVNTIQSRQS
jgi:hypothetical protein